MTPYACRFTVADGDWQVTNPPLTPAMIAESCGLETLPADPKSQSEFIGKRCAHYLRSLDITRGPLLRAVYFHAHDEKKSRLFLVIHHLVVDDVSWRVLLRDLDVSYRQLSSNGPIQLAAENSTYQQWAQALTAYATSDALQRERDYWRENTATSADLWPVPPLSKEAATYANVRSVPVHLNVETQRHY
jgi:NRPS condensation-like uncharacterized protein